MGLSAHLHCSAPQQGSQLGGEGSGRGRGGLALPCGGLGVCASLPRTPAIGAGPARENGPREERPGDQAKVTQEFGTPKPEAGRLRRPRGPRPRPRQDPSRVLHQPPTQTRRLGRAGQGSSSTGTPCPDRVPQDRSRPHPGVEPLPPRPGRDARGPHAGLAYHGAVALGAHRAPRDRAAPGGRAGAAP